jgi:hypothetical protein
VLRSLNELKSVGPDGVSPRLLKHCAKELARPLTDLFQKVTRAAEFPKSWKVARVTPVYKKNKVTDPQNYRPISVLPTLATTFERVLMPQLSAFLLPHIPEEQFGFIPDTGTLDVGAVLADQIAQALQAKKDVRLVALDFKGAFDKVWWRGLLAHLWAVGVRAKAYKLFESYLSDRALFVASNGEISEHVGIKSGVPQGAIWSPLLFDLFVRNVPQRVRAALRKACHFYADDLTLVKEVEREERAARLARRELDTDLHQLYLFGKEWLLEFEPKKSQGLVVSNTKKRKNTEKLHPPLRMGRIAVKEKKEMEILGLTIDARGNWSRHIQAIASDARKRLGAIRRMSHMLDDKSIMRAYKAFVRSKIEYGSLAYWGAAESHLKKLDRIQESAVALLRNPDPSLLPPSLESRREQAAIGFTCKLLDGRGRGMARTLTPEFDDPSAPKPRRSARLAAARPQHLHQLRPVHLPPSSLATFKRCYRARIPGIWNDLRHPALQQQHIQEYLPLKRQLHTHGR